MNKVLELGQVKAASLPTEHFFVVAGDLTVKAVLERMRDDECPVAVFMTDKGVSTLTAEVVMEKVVGQPTVWDQPALSIAVETPSVNVQENARSVHDRLHNGVVVVRDENGPVGVVSRVTWMKFLNQAYNTMVFNHGPEVERRERSRARV